MHNRRSYASAFSLLVQPCQIRPIICGDATRVADRVCDKDGYVPGTVLSSMLSLPFRPLTCYSAVSRLWPFPQAVPSGRSYNRECWPFAELAHHAGRHTELPTKRVPEVTLGGEPSIQRYRGQRVMRVQHALQGVSET